MVTINVWTAPNGHQRVYLNGLALTSRFTKVWAEPCAMCMGSDFRIVARDDYRGSSELANLVNDAEKAIDTAAGRAIRAWADLLAFAEKKA